MIAEQVKTRIIEKIAHYGSLLKGYRIVLFGSRAAGTARPRSDFDVGIIGDTPVPLKTFFLIGESLDTVETLHRIDWVDLNRASENFKKEALKKTEVLYGN
jgi:predicted nucleotidyltransferase